MNWNLIWAYVGPFFHFAGWFIIAIALPVGLPLGFFWLIWDAEPDSTDAEKAAEKLSVHPIQAIKDGQLLWVTLALCFTGMWEAGLTSIGRAVAVGALLVIAVPCTLLIGRYLGKTIPLPPEKQQWKSQLKLMRRSIFLTTCAIVICSIVHLKYAGG